MCNKKKIKKLLKKGVLKGTITRKNMRRCHECGEILGRESYSSLCPKCWDNNQGSWHNFDD